MRPIKVIGVEKKLEFRGGYTSDEIERIKKVHGIYAAFACIYDENENIYECINLVYIGKGGGTSNVYERISKHVNNDKNEAESGKQCNWERDYCRNGEVIVYVYAECNTDFQSLEDIEAALIYRNQPKANSIGKDRYTGRAWSVNVECTGEKGMIANEVKVFRI